MAGRTPSGQPIQQLLFPDSVQLLAMAHAALRDLDLAPARALLARARTAGPRTVNHEVLEQALDRLSALVGAGGEVSAERLADIVGSVGQEVLAGRISPPVAEFVDETIARYSRRREVAGEWVDEGRRLHRGVFDLILGDPAAARRHLESSLSGGHAHRADLWGYRGDCAVELDHRADVSPCYVRALLLSDCGEEPVTRIDLARCRYPALVGTYRILTQRLPDVCARALLLAEAWIGGVLEIPAQNGWVDERGLPGPLPPFAGPVERHRRFAGLFYMDRSMPHGRAGLSLREEMAALDPDLFRRYMDRCRDVEGRTGRP